MSLYERALRHSRRMFAYTGVAIVAVIASDQLFGNWTYTAALAVMVLFMLNIRMLAFNCPNCGSNLFYRGVFALPWPNRTCSRCGADIARAP